MGIPAEYPQKYPQNKKIQKNFAGRDGISSLPRFSANTEADTQWQAMDGALLQAPTRSQKINC